MSMTGKEQMQKYRAKHPEFVKKETLVSKLKMRERRKNPVIRARMVQEVREWRRNLRYEIFTRYSGEQPKCAICGYADMRALCLDHINNDGAEHRRSINSSGRGGNAVGVYLDLKKRGYPSGYQILCHNCNRIKEVERNVQR